MPTSRENAVFTLGVLGAGGNSKNTTMLDAISRAVMRNPSADSQILSAELKDSLNEFFKDKSDAQIEWILSNATESRGHFANAQAMRDFLSGKTPTSPSAQTAAIDGILSAINYSRFGKVPGGEPELLAIQEQVGKLQSEGTKVPYIGDTHSQRHDDMKPGRIRRVPLTKEALEKKAAMEGDLISAPNRAISVASGFSLDEGMVDSPKQMPQLQQFKNQGYAKLANDSGVPLMGHISGTTPGNLKVADSLLQMNGKKGLTPERAATLAGATAASFHRSGFHAPAEVLVGLKHYLGEHATVDNTPKTEDEMKQLFRESTELMAKAGAQQIPDAVAVIIDDIVAHPSLSDKGEIPVTEVQKEVQSVLISGIDMSKLQDDPELGQALAMGPESDEPFEELDMNDEETASLLSEIDALAPQEDGIIVPLGNAHDHDLCIAFKQKYCTQKEAASPIPTAKSVETPFEKGEEDDDNAQQRTAHL